MNKKIFKKNKEIIKLIISDLVPVIADDLQIGFHKADEIVRGTDLYKVLISECILQDDYNSDNLLLILHKELVRSGKYPIQNGNKEVEDLHDFVRTMRHEIIYNCTIYKKFELNLTQVSLLVEGIENFVVGNNAVQSVKDISDTLNKYVHHMDPIRIGKGEIECANNFNEIFWKFNADLQVLFAHCLKHGKRPVDLTEEEIDLYVG